MQYSRRKLFRYMNKLILFCLSLLMSTSVSLASEPITLKQVTSGEFAAEGVSGINPIKGTDQYARVSADGKRVEQYSFKTGKLTSVLFDVDHTQGEQIKGFDGYVMSPDGTRMLIATKREKVYRRSYKAVFYIYTIKSRKLEKLSDGGPQQCPVWSPDGLQVAFVRDNNIFLVKLLYDNAESQVTKDGKFNEIINGIPDWVNEEEFEFNTALTFNADGTMLCWLKYDEKNVGQYSLQLYKGSHPAHDDYSVYPGVYSYKYPKAGQDNSKMSAWSYDIKSHRTQKLQVPLDADGYNHIYVYNHNGQLLRKVAPGNYDITDVYGMDEATGDIYYQAAALNPHDRQVYVAHKNGKTERLTRQEGWNTAVFSGDFKYFLNSWSDYNTPYVYTTRSNNGNVIATNVDNKKLKEKIARFGWVKKEPFSFTTSEGVKLDGWMVKPADFNASRKYPVIMFQYSGPGNQQVVNSWSAGSMGQGGAYDMYLAQQGFIVVCVDGRGTGGRGAEFEKCTYQKLGALESKDQVETALYLGTLPYVDKANIGIWGWSFGGFCTLMSMSEGRPVFKAGVAVAPPTSWRYYDTVYTERYMRTPQENPTGYDDCPISRAPKLNGALLICHGSADDNVHPQNTFEYSEALVQADKDFKENIYTNRNHSIYGGNTRNHLLRQITQWFMEHLK